MSEQTNTVIDNICDLTQNSDVKNFARILYKEVSSDALDSIDPRDLSEAASSMFKLLQDRMPHVSNVNITKLGKDKDYAVLEIVTKEVPFLVESISNELKKHEAIINLIVHPSVNIERKKKGEIVEIGKSKAEQEAVMQFFILNQFTDDYYLKIKQRIRSILDCVLVTVQDWEAMQQSVKEFIKDWGKYSQEKENIKFLEWLLEDHFIFLGSFHISSESGKRSIDYDNALGIAKTHLYQDELKAALEAEDPEPKLFIRKSNTRSVVHRDDHMNCIHLKQFDKKGHYIGTYVIMGFFTSSVYRKSVREIPLIRDKVSKVIVKYGYNESSYNSKELVTMLESFSRSDLVQMNEDELFELATGMVSLNLMPRIKVLTRIDQVSQLVHCFVFIPKIRFGSEVINIVERILSQQINGTIYRRYISVGESQMARLQVVIKPNKSLKKDYNVRKIEELVSDATIPWLEDLLSSLSIKHSKQIAIQKYNKFKNAFDIRYTSNFASKQAVHDIKMIELALSSKQVKFDFYTSSKSGKDLLQLKVFSPSKELPLSVTLPVLENIGFFIIDTLTFNVALREESQESNVFIHYFRLKIKNLDNVNLPLNTKNNIETLLEKIWDNKIENDKLNSLALYAGLKWKEVLLIRSFTSYLKQIKFPYDYIAISDSITSNPSVAQSIVQLFHLKFNPDNYNENDRKVEIASLLKSLEESLNQIESIVSDKVIRAYINLVMAIKRTNFFQKNHDELETSGLALKIFSSEVNDIPLPKPFFEIFVYSSRFEAIHLRGGKIARGGLRWSDRRDDYRTEVLGLMKAQMTKNSVIVPVGSKGGFILKRSVEPELYMTEGIECYKSFLRGLLDITDNVIEGNIIPPKDVIRHDEDDSYLVVAADKGTASFSDYANSVAKEYGFWLSDAFASGGSAGYDHKKMAITSRGAWISALDHFNHLGLDIDKHSFTAIGIGDMSGDVFGNGFLLSKNCKLVAAFNHMHIFLDPNPDPEKSFAERKRLFNIERSKWSDYNTNIISEGGGVFLRSAKSITISTEMQRVLGTDQKTLSADELVNTILKAPVDMLWNGGIGTYVKSTEEVNENIGDKSNDTVRINGKDVRAKMIIEGGNLGCTQLGRVEYERSGGKINTDFIDNSGGVDCSDHEVNIKIAFSELIRNSKLNIEDRNDLLVKMTDDIAELVLKDNKQQTLLLSIEKNRGKQRISEHFWLMKNLEIRGELNRDVEKLPPAEDFAIILNKYNSLTRPEISVLTAYAKNSASAILADNNKKFDKYLDSYLISYFPELMQTQFKDTILGHKLKSYIIITAAVNHFINILGCCLFHQMLEQGHDAIDIIHAFVIAINSMDGQKTWDKVIELQNKISSVEKLRFLRSISKNIEKSLIWLLENRNYLKDIAKSIEEIKNDRLILISLYKNSEIEDTGLPKATPVDNAMTRKLLSELSDMEYVSNVLDVITIAKRSNKAVLDAANAYMSVTKSLGLDALVSQVKSIDLIDYADNMALNAIISELHCAHNEMTTAIIADDQIRIRNIDKMKWYKDFIHDILKNINNNNAVSTTVLALKRLKEITKTM